MAFRLNRDGFSVVVVGDSDRSASPRSQSQAVSEPTQRSGSIGMMALMIRRSVLQRRVTRLHIEALSRSTVKLSAERDRRRAR
jgi:hypothetical protein